MATRETGGASLCPKLRIFAVRVEVCRVNFNSIDHNALIEHKTHPAIYVRVRCLSIGEMLCGVDYII